MNVVIRRRAGLMGLIAGVAAAFAAAYLWRFSQTEGEIALLFGVALGVVAVAHALAWGDARTPLLVADEMGLRVRLGGDWTGLTWQQIDSVEVDDRGRVTDGHVAVLAADPAAALAQANLRSRLGAAFNRWVYDAPLVVPFGLTTTVSVVDVGAALAHLADGRAPIISLDAEAEPEPTVEVTSPGINTEPPEPSGELAESFAREYVERPDSAAELLADPEPVADPDEPVAEVEPDDVPGIAPTPAPAAAPRRLAWPIPKLARSGRRGDADAPAAAAVSPLSSPARRAEVTMPVRREPTTEGMLALSASYADTEPLPEIAELRRTDPDDEPRRDAPDPNRGNVSLIIDATTDLSAKAMRKVRRPILGATVDETDSPTAVTDEGASEEVIGELLIGGTVSTARRQLGLTVDELAERTRIRPFVIESIEVDDFAPCGGDFYARGHLRMLARVLGIDAEPLVATYDESFGDQPINARAVFDAELTSGTTGMVRGGTSGSNWGGLIATVLVIVLIWGVAQYLSGRPGAAPDETAPPQNSAGLGSPGAGNRPVPPAEPRQTFVKVMARGGESRVVVLDSSGDFAFRGWLSDGDSTRVVGTAPLRVMAVDAGVIALRIEGRQLGLMGDEGQRAFRRIPASR